LSRRALSGFALGRGFTGDSPLFTVLVVVFTCGYAEFTNIRALAKL
jgi:hypothetical protein